jgi:hypothetical protein
MVDAAASNVAGRETVGVQIPRRAPSLEGDVRGASRCGRGGTGRRGGLKICCPRACRFETDRPHQDALWTSVGSRAFSMDGMPDRVLMRVWCNGSRARFRCWSRKRGGGSSPLTRTSSRSGRCSVCGRGVTGSRAALRWLSWRQGGGSIPLGRTNRTKEFGR